MIEIIPAIMAKNYAQLVDEVMAVKDATSTIQIDVMDGVFVSGKSWPLDMVDETHFLEMVREEEGMPYWNDIAYELDLMVSNPQEELSRWLALRPQRIVFHLESLDNPREVLESVQELRSEIEIGISFDKDFNLDLIDELVPYIDYVQCMGIAQIGAQGQPFSEHVIDQLHYLVHTYPGLLLSVDGAVNEDTIPHLVQAGARRLIVGSAIFGTGDALLNFELLQDIANSQ